MIGLLLLAACAPATCGTACEAMVGGCDASPFESAAACVDACEAAEAASATADTTLACYEAAGCDAAAVADCARTETRRGGAR